MYSDPVEGHLGDTTDKRLLVAGFSFCHTRSITFLAVESIKSLGTATRVAAVSSAGTGASVLARRADYTSIH